jgi:hypothetical protein
MVKFRVDATFFADTVVQCRNTHSSFVSAFLEHVSLLFGVHLLTSCDFRAVSSRMSAASKPHARVDMAAVRAVLKARGIPEDQWKLIEKHIGAICQTGRDKFRLRRSGAYVPDLRLSSDMVKAKHGKAPEITNPKDVNSKFSRSETVRLMGQYRFIWKVYFLFSCAWVVFR